MFERRKVRIGVLRQARQPAIFSFERFESEDDRRGRIAKLERIMASHQILMQVSAMISRRKIACGMELRDRSNPSEWEGGAATMMIRSPMKKRVEVVRVDVTTAELAMTTNLRNVEMQ